MQDPTTLPAPSWELVLDRLTPPQVAQLCQISLFYQRFCDDYWPGRAARLLDTIPPEATPGTGATTLTPYQRYLLLWNLCSPKSKDKPLTTACGREVGKRADNVEIREYLLRGGNPQDVVYGLASVSADQQVADLLTRYSDFQRGMLRNIVRGWGNGGHDSKFLSAYERGQIKPISTGEGMRIFLEGALDSGQPHIIWSGALLAWGSGSEAANHLAGRGFPEVAVSRGFTPKAQPLERALGTRDLNYLRDYFNSNQTSRIILEQKLIQQGSPALFEELFRMGLPLNISKLLVGLLQERPDIFLLVVKWLQNNMPLSPSLLDDLKEKAERSQDWGLTRWAANIGATSDESLGN